MKAKTITTHCNSLSTRVWVCVCVWGREREREREKERERERELKWEMRWNREGCIDRWACSKGTWTTTAPPPPLAHKHKQQPAWALSYVFGYIMYSSTTGCCVVHWSAALSRKKYSSDRVSGDKSIVNPSGHAVKGEREAEYGVAQQNLGIGACL